MKMEGYYSAWDSYAEDEDTVGKMMANGRVREGRLARRARRRESLKDKRQGYLDERAARKMLVSHRPFAAAMDLQILVTVHMQPHTHPHDNTPQPISYFIWTMAWL